jgi:acetyl-CoA carboxylase biotin carboxyl carrier protein
MNEELLAPLAGMITQMDINVGDKVEEDDDALVIEAMKMETRIYVPCSGVVREVRVKKGDKVEEDDIIAVIQIN